MTERYVPDNPLADCTLVRKRKLLEILDCGEWSLRRWSREEGFPKPVFVSDGSPARWRLGEILRWLDRRQRKRRRPIRRGRLKRGAV